MMAVSLLLLFCGCSNRLVSYSTGPDGQTKVTEYSFVFVCNDILIPNKIGMHFVADIKETNNMHTDGIISIYLMVFLGRKLELNEA